jgi:hypothetical protein
MEHGYVDPWGRAGPNKCYEFRMSAIKNDNYEKLKLHKNSRSFIFVRGIFTL